MASATINDAVESRFSYRMAGYNCAQTVLLVMMEHFNKPSELWENISAPFGGGMANTHRSVCGAISGGLMVIGIMEQGDKGAAGAEMLEFVKAKYGHINCDKILDIDFGDEEQVAREKDPKQDTVCTPIKRDICQWLAKRCASQA